MTNVDDVDFSREQRILDLAYKLHDGLATSEEQRQAADSLSFAAGERLGLERKCEALEAELEFMKKILGLFWRHDINDSLFWRTEWPHGDKKIKFFAVCSDTFTWATADAEEITPENVHILEMAFADVSVVRCEKWWGPLLFAARVRGMRPMPKLAIPDPLKELFNACGPERTSNDDLH